jgi:acyl-CoA synthetase (AMP-forming)/AMP-acid ligase II
MDLRNPPDLAMGDTLVRNATWFADTPAYVADGRSLSHAQLYARAARLASALAGAGVHRQDRVSVLGRNSIEYGEVLAAGMPFPGNEVRITGDDGAPCPPGQAGEVCVRSVAMFRGYWNNHAATAEVLRDGWCHTGDIGVLDDEGLLHLVDRKKDVIISGGENIYSLEVEECLLAHPSVGQVAVIGVPDDKWGEAVGAVVVPADGAAVVPGDLQEHVRSSLARYKAPRHVFVTDQLPVLPTGKVDKKLLRARYADPPLKGPAPLRRDVHLAERDYLRVAMPASTFSTLPVK